MPKKYAQCDKCGCKYDDEESIRMVELWLANPDKYAPCPNIGCRGQMQVKEE